MAEMTEMLLVLLYTLHASAICGNQDTKNIETSEEGLVSEKEFPWIVSLQDSHYTHLTFGSILSQFWILSIASAFQNRKDAIAIVGIAKMDGRVITHEEYPIEKIVIHEDFDNKTMANNIALLKTDTAMHFNNLTGHHMTMSILRKISVKNIDLCPLHNYEKTGCGYHVEKETDAVCLGDPGNPMMCQLQHLNLWVLRGILSKGGERCPGLFLYIRVEDYSAWITSKTKRTGLPLSVLHHWEHSIPFFSNSSNASVTHAKNSELGGAIWSQNYFQRLRGAARDAGPDNSSSTNPDLNETAMATRQPLVVPNLANMADTEGLDDMGSLADTGNKTNTIDMAHMAPVVHVVNMTDTANKTGPSHTGDTGGPADTGDPADTSGPADTGDTGGPAEVAGQPMYYDYYGGGLSGQNGLRQPQGITLFSFLLVFFCRGM